MEKLRAYLNSMFPIDQTIFAAECGTSIGYLRKAISTKQQIGEKICIEIDRASGGVVTCEDIRPDVNWAYLRNQTSYPRPAVTSNYK